MIVVTGATGQLGRLVVADLLERGVPASQIVAAVRDTEKAADLAAQGVQVRHADYDDPQSLKDAFTGADKLLLISASVVGRRVPQHENAIDAAVAVGVPFLAYTSILKADTTGVALAGEHKETEAYLAASGLPYALLRNSWYTENYTGSAAAAIAAGAVLGSAGTGRVGAVPRADYAAAAAAVLTTDGHAGQVYELAADEPFTMAEYAAELADASGQPVSYQDLPADAYAEALTGFGLDAGYAAALADADLGIARGDLASDSGDLARLIGRPTTSLADAVRSAV
ncbi:MAG: SDR family oxidoreductase [Hamadaea sp.]|uniref:SDR family oxidoreductase n=1 Tax=Hamadaea sp. TaxID=2024425 RepID=UPI00182B7D83|nr:SDR family oxidoreductase [Hamadaea sp.]NUT22208.1 SDR family oxidoreductase [Hamadaea sp.]